MKQERIYHMKFKDLYPLYVLKAERKGKTSEEVDELLMWLTGYTSKDLKMILDSAIDVKTFFDDSPLFNPSASLIKGSICGIKVEDIQDPLMQKIRYLDKIIDELAKGKTMDKIKRKI